MFNTENIVKKNQQLNGSISAVYGTLRFEKQYLPEEFQTSLDELMEKMRNLTAEIERETGWKYDGYGFVCNSNFIYDAYREQITFIENGVAFDNGRFIPKHNTLREVTFLKKNQEKLQRLEILTKQRNYFDAYGYTIMSNTDDENAKAELTRISLPTPFQIKQNEELISGDLAATRFYNDFGNEGLVRLIHWLNQLANTENPSTIYDSLLNENIPENMKEQILFWVTMYSSGGSYLEAEYYKRKQKAEKKPEGQKGKK